MCLISKRRLVDKQRCGTCKHWRPDVEHPQGNDYGRCADPDPCIKWDDETHAWQSCEHWEEKCKST